MIYKSPWEQVKQLHSQRKLRGIAAEIRERKGRYTVDGRLVEIFENTLVIDDSTVFRMNTLEICDELSWDWFIGNVPF